MNTTQQIIPVRQTVTRVWQTALRGATVSIATVAVLRALGRTALRAADLEGQELRVEQRQAAPVLEESLLVGH